MNTNTHHTSNIHHATVPQGLGRKQATFRSRRSTRFMVVFCVMIAYAAVLIWFLVKGYRVTPGLPFLALSIYGQRLGRQTRLVRVHERGLCFGTVDALQPVAFSSIADVWLSSPTAVDMTLVDGRTMQLTANLTRAAQLVAAVQAALAPQQAWAWPTVSSSPTTAVTTHDWAPPIVNAVPAAVRFAPPAAPQPVAVPSAPALATTSTGGRAAVLVVLAIALVAGIGLGARSLVASDSVAAVADRSTDSADESEATEAPELVATTAPTVESKASTAPPFTLPSTTTPATTVAPETTVPAHQLAGLQVGQCVDANNSIIGCVRGAELVMAVSPAAGLACNSGETLLEVTQTPAVPATVSACLLPWYLDDRSLEQVFEVDSSCAVPPASERTAFEVELLKCSSSTGSVYYLVKVQEAQIADYLREVLAASFLGDWSTTDGEVCGGYFQSDGWDVYVYGNGPFVEYRQLDDSEGVSFSRSLCVA